MGPSATYEERWYIKKLNTAEGRRCQIVLANWKDYMLISSVMAIRTHGLGFWLRASIFFEAAAIPMIFYLKGTALQDAFHKVLIQKLNYKFYKDSNDI